MRPVGPIRVLVVEDAPIFARALASALEQAGDLHAAHTSGETEQVRSALLQFHPEVILLDLDLRLANTMLLLAKLRRHYPVPVIVMSRAGADSSGRAMQAIQQGALEVVEKPESARVAAFPQFVRDLAAKVRMALSARPVSAPAHAVGSAASWRAAGLDPGRYLVAIGASTGGTKALEVLLRRVPADFPPVVMVQHMPVGFTRTFAERLNAESVLAITEAVEGDQLAPGRAVLARGDTHLVVRPGALGWVVRYTDQRLYNRHCPSVDVLFESVADVVGSRAVGVLLTGMGDDGARGLLSMRHNGGVTVAQSRESCVVYGMPKVAVDLGAVMHSAAPEDIPGVILRAVRQRPRPAAALVREGS